VTQGKVRIHVTLR